MVAKVASGRAEQHTEEKLALEGHQQLRRGPSRHHSRHLGHTSSPSSSLDTAVSLSRCANSLFLWGGFYVGVVHEISPPLAKTS